MSKSFIFQMEIDMGRRIAEILDHKGISPYSFSQRIGMGKDTFYNCLKGKRYLKGSEIEKIASELRLTVERLRQEDIAKERSEMLNLVQKRLNPKRSLELGLELKKIAIGCTEKFDVLNALGKAYFQLGKFEQAQEVWLEAVPFAEKIHEKFQDMYRLYDITTNLIGLYTERKEYTILHDLLFQVESRFGSDRPEMIATIRYSQAMVAFHLGNRKEGKKKMYDYLTCSEQVGDRQLFGRALHNVAYLEYQLGNYEESRQKFKEAIQVLSDFPHFQYISYKDYTKTIWKLRKKDYAVEILHSCLASLESMEYPEIRAKFLLLTATFTNDPAKAEQVLADERVSEGLKVLACKYLMDYCRKTGDDAGVAKYYKTVAMFNDAGISFDWEVI